MDFLIRTSQNFVASPPRDSYHHKTPPKVKAAASSSAKQEQDAASDTAEPTTPHVAHESLFESYLLTTPVLGGSSGLPPDTLLQLCLQVGVSMAQFIEEL